MVVGEAFLLSIHFVLGSTLSFEKPATKAVWQEKCIGKSMVLNDCNWCRCVNQQYVCEARSCREVDMFGHFNDAIREYEVGMEGHGSWRSTKTACEPGVHYRRGSLLCVCGEDGVWPNPICRDLFRMLHAVKVANEIIPKKSLKCTPNNLYLIGCNLCHCKASGYIDPEVCIKTTCDKDDPIKKATEIEYDDEKIKDDEIIVHDIYAECNPNLKYKLGCKTCSCLRNNRLICDNCTNTETRDMKVSKISHNYCSNVKVGAIFDMDCNYCYCDDKGYVFCTTKRCLPKNIGTLDKKINKVINSDIQSVETPYEDPDCTPGTKYKKGCNTCYCFLTADGKKSFICTLKKCNSDENALIAIQSDCVNGTNYELNCLRCTCHIIDGTKWQSCKVNSLCASKIVRTRTKSDDLDSLHGYCEPLHIYKKGCNICRCLSDGKATMCTAKICKKKPIEIEIVPISQSGAAPCPRGHSYKVDCNYCFCLSNGNSLCTTIDCDKEKLNLEN